MTDKDRPAPMFNQNAWAVRDAYNVAGDLELSLGENARPIINAPNLKLPKRFSSPRRMQQEQLIERHKLFGGRDNELVRLDEFVAGSTRRFHFIHAPSGFGKTALLANWVVRLRQQAQPVCWQFINRFENMADEEFALRNLCEQLAALHGILDELPASVADLRNAYVSLLKIPLPETTLIVVLDGLDETKGWSPGPYLFPMTLPKNTHIVFSARAETEDEIAAWLSRVGLDAGQADILHLGPLDSPAVARLLEAAGGKATPLAKDRSFVGGLTGVSKGDPFYLHFLAKDVAEGVITPATISKQPRDLQSYLDRWKEQLFEDVDIEKDEVSLILGLLCVALGPMKPAEFSGVSPVLKKSLLLERELTGPMRRYLSGGRDTGYALGHPRFRDYLAHHVFHDDNLADYRNLLLDYCRNWHQNRSEYALNHLAMHLADLDLRQELYALPGKEWKDARARLSGSPLGLVTDLEVAIGKAISSSPPDTVAFTTCALAHATVKSIVEQVLPELLGAMTRLDGHPAALRHAGLIRNPERRSLSYNAIAAVLEQDGNIEAAVEVLALSLASAERVPDTKARAQSVLGPAKALQRFGNLRLVQRAGEVLEATASDLDDPAVLEQAALFFEAGGQSAIAADLRARAGTAKGVKASGFQIDFSWLSSVPELASADPIKSAESLLDEGRVDEAMTILLSEQENVENQSQRQPEAYVGNDWFTLAKAFARAGDSERAASAADRAFESAVAAVPGPFFDSRTQRLLGLARALDEMGLRTTAHRCAQAAWDGFDPESLVDNFQTIAPLPAMLIHMGFAEEARTILSGILREIEIKASRPFESVAIAALTSAAALAGRIDEAKRAFSIGSAESWRSIPIEWWPQYLVARLNGGEAELATLKKEAESPSDGRRTLGKVYVGRALAMLGQFDAAREITEEAFVNPDEPFLTGDAVLQAARNFLLCHDNDRAARLAEEFKASNSEKGSDSVAILVQAGAADALKHSAKAFDDSIQYKIVGTGRLCELLVELEERPKALDLLRAGVLALDSMEPYGWEFVCALPEIASAAGAIGDDTTLRLLKKQVERSNGKASPLLGRSALGLAFATRRSPAEAREQLDFAVKLILSSKQEDYDVRKHLENVAAGLALMEDAAASLKALCAWALAGNKYSQPELITSLLPALAKVGEKATVITALDTFTWNRWAQRSIVLAAGVSALLQLGDADAAVLKAADALEAFFQERDGSVTPNVLPHLISALVATGNGDGLVRIAQMSAEKWPYQREWGPGVRLLLPALARLGLDDVRPRPYKVFLSEKNYLDEAQIELAEVYAGRGLYDRALSTLQDILSLRARAVGHFRLGQLMAKSGDLVRSQECLMLAVSYFPAIGSNVLVGEMASLANRIGAPPRLCWMLKQTFLRAADYDVMRVDVDLYRNAARVAVQIGDKALLGRVKATVSVPLSPGAKAATAAALVRALAESGRHPELDKLQDIVHGAVGQIGDVTHGAIPLLDLAHALSAAGRSREAKDCMIQALNCARHAGRPLFLDIFSKGAAILLHDTSASDLAKSIVEVGRLWL